MIGQAAVTTLVVYGYPNGPTWPALFLQLLVVMGQIGWNIDPSFLFDHDHCCFDLLAIDESTLFTVLWDG